MIGSLQENVTNEFRKSFEKNCILLFFQAYTCIREKEHVGIDWEEENISANFFMHIDNSENAIGYNINISDECRLYYNSILSGEIPAKKAARIDFRFTTNWVEKKQKFKFYVEAKNLIQFDCSKDGRKTPLLAKSIKKRYIKTGIDNFTKQQYPKNGCLIGYVLQGDPDSIIDDINTMLVNSGRNDEILTSATNNIVSHSYYSRHCNELVLMHYLFDFCSN